MLDGQRYRNPYLGMPLDINDVVNLWEIRAIEVYTDPAFVPNELRLKETIRLSCGVIFIWTFRALG